MRGSSNDVSRLLDRARKVALGREELLEAEGASLEVLSRNARDYEALRLLAIVRSCQRHYLEARILLLNALAIRTEDAVDIHFELSTILLDHGHFDEALNACDKVLVLAPMLARAHRRRGEILRRLGRTEEAIESLDRALTLRPDYAPALADRALALHDIDHFGEALVDHLKAIALQPDNPELHFKLAMTKFSVGDLADAWREAEWRWQGENRLFRRQHPQPRWDGLPVSGTLLAWGEQGLGDQIVFAGMVPELLDRADKVVLEVEPRLIKLFARSFPRATVVGAGEDRYGGPVTAQEPLGSLGRHLRRNWKDFPQRRQGYLIADAERTTALRQRLVANGKSVIGLSWISRSTLYGKSKSATLRDFAPLFRVPNCEFVDLQYGDTQGERDAVAREFGVTVRRIDEIDNTNDLDGLASLVSACDVVVSVSNVTAHLAGALGQPTWVMIPHGMARIWYWFIGKERSPWYPRVYVRRQERGQAWADVVAATAEGIFAPV